MITCLLSLGSNMGHCETTLRAAFAQIDALPDVHLVRYSSFHPSKPIGGPARQNGYVNAAAVVETTLPPLRLLTELQGIESHHGRKRGERWSARPLDIDLLLYGDEVTETRMLTLPHPRMSFRRFMLAPAAEIAPKMFHPVIGWPVERLLLHLNAARDEVAMLSPSTAMRDAAAGLMVERFGARMVDRPTFATAEQLWPATVTSWISLPSLPGVGESASVRRGGLPYAAAAFPKLNILLDGHDESQRIIGAEWSAIVRQPGRGPSLRLQEHNHEFHTAEIAAAVEAVWPDLGSAEANRVK